MFADLLTSAYQPSMRVHVPAMTLLLMNSRTEPQPLPWDLRQRCQKENYGEECDLSAENGETAGCTAATTAPTMRRMCTAAARR